MAEFFKIVSTSHISFSLIFFVEPMSPTLHNLYSFLGVGMVTVAEMVMMRIPSTQYPEPNNRPVFYKCI